MKIKVKAAIGVCVPQEDQPHSAITDNEVVEVENSLYYQRRLAEGDLVLVQGGSSGKKSATGEKGNVASSN